MLPQDIIQHVVMLFAYNSASGVGFGMTGIEHFRLAMVSFFIINPRRACAARVTVVVLSVCLYVCPNTLFWQYAQLEV